MKFDETDAKIMKNLLTDARLSSRQIAHKMGLSTVTVISRIRKLQQKKVIRGYSARLDHESLGYDITAIIEITTGEGKMLEIENEMSESKNVCGVYDITGDSDIMIIAKFKTRKDLSEFIKKISTMQNVENTVTHLALNTVKEDFRLM